MVSYSPLSSGAGPHNLSEAPYSSPRSGENGPPKAESDEILMRSSKSALEVNQEELEKLIAAAENDCPEYADVCREANVFEDIPCDCWGALIFIVVKDFPDLWSGRAVCEGKVRIAFSFIFFVINVAMQFNLLIVIGRLLMVPGILSTQNLYKSFHDDAFSDGVLDQERWDQMPDKEELCGMALSHGLFVRVILFLWVITNVEELRDTFKKARGTAILPRLPDELDTRLMVRQLPQLVDKDSDFCVVCLNLSSKIGLFTLVFIPKFIIAFTLMLTGCLWLLAAEEIADLILNSLALSFVTKVDELLGRVFFPQKFQDNITSLTLVLPSDVAEKDAEAAMYKRTREYLWSGVLLVANVVVVECLVKFQPVLPNYAGDVNAACISYINSQVPWCLPGQQDCFPIA